MLINTVLIIMYMKNYCVLNFFESYHSLEVGVLEEPRECRGVAQVERGIDLIQNLLKKIHEIITNIF